MHQRQCLQAGFSLLEVIVAFAIAAIALGVLSQIFGQGTRNMALARDYDNAILLAESLLAEHGVNIATDEASFSATNEQFQWEVLVQPYISRESVPDLTSTPDDDAATQSRLVQIDVVVDWERNGKLRSVNLSSLRLFAENRNASPFKKSL